MAESIVESPTETILNVAKTGKIEVLHVDDDLVFLMVAKQCLEMQGEIEVDTASSVNEALEKLRKTDYDAIVSDYQMPDKDGLEFLKELREKGNTVPFIVFTGKGREEVAKKALNLGADQYIDKNGDPETVYCELAYAIQYSVNRKSEHIELLKREAKLYAFLESSPEAITVSDLNGNIVECNQATVDLHSCQSKEDLIGKNAFEFIAKKDREKAIQSLKKTIEQGSTKNIEYTFLTKDGCEFPAELSASVVRDTSGKPEYFMAITKDITERRLMEQKYVTIIKTALDGFLITDSKGRFIDVNDAYCRMIGYTREELLSMSIHDIEESEKLKETTEHIKKVLKEGHDRFETSHRRKNGAVINVEVSVYYYPVDEGQLIVFIRDVTERMKAEGVLRGSEEKWRSLAENAPNIIMIVDRFGIIQFINRTVVDARPEEIVGKSIYDFIDPEHHNLVKKTIEQVYQTGEGGRYEISGVGPKGGVSWYETHVGPIKRDGQVVSVTLITTDITERKKVEEALRESMESYRELTESISDVFFAMDKDFRYTYWNKASEKLTGISAKDAIGKSLTEVFPDVKGTIVEQFYKEALRTRQPRSYLNKYQLRGKDYVFEINAYPTRDGISVFVKDITDLKNAEERLKEINKKLEVTNEKLHVVGSLTRHDVRNKLSAVTGNAYLLRRKLAEDPGALEQLNDMEAAVRLVEEIFQFAGTYEKLGIEQLASMDVGKAFDEAVSLFSDLKDVKIVNECRGLTVLADSLLRQLFYNLIDDSLKYGEKIRRIRVLYRTPSADKLELVYEDDGAGIPDNMRSSLFKEGVGKGTGYGLFMIKRICEVYGWTIEEKGIPGKGVQFVMTIPKKSAKWTNH